MIPLGEELDPDDTMDRLSLALHTSRYAALLLADGTVLQVELTSASGWIPDAQSADTTQIEVRANVRAGYDRFPGTDMPLPIHNTKELP
jgi:hypothetical protein